MTDEPRNEIVRRPLENGWMATVDRARQALERVESVDEAAVLVSAAETAKVYARNVMRSREAQDHAAHVALLCQRKAGQLLAAMPKNEGLRFAGGNTVLPPQSSTLAEIGVTKIQSSRWQRLADIPDDQFDAAVGEIIEKGEELTTAGLLRRVVGPYIGQATGDNEYFTPAPYIVAARQVMGSIDLDPASCAAANEVVGATEYYTAEQNGLTKRWLGAVWMNPPYAQPLIYQFSTKLADDYWTGDVAAACVLVNSATETAWFQTLAGASSAICFPRGRVKFWPLDKGSTPLQGQAVIYLGKNPELFRSVFDVFGVTVMS